MSLQTNGYFRLMNEAGFITKMRSGHIGDDGQSKATLQTADSPTGLERVPAGMRNIGGFQ